MGLFNKKKTLEKQVHQTISSDQIVFLSLDNSSDETLLKIADQMKEHIPYIINFEGLDIDDINKSIAFLSGITYALNGEVVIIKEKILMFGDELSYEDGSLKTFVQELN
jgi:cell division inhibitor SepF